MAKSFPPKYSDFSCEFSFFFHLYPLDRCLHVLTQDIVGLANANFCCICFITLLKKILTNCSQNNMSPIFVTVHQTSSAQNWGLVWTWLIFSFNCVSYCWTVKSEVCEHRFRRLSFVVCRADPWSESGVDMFCSDRAVSFLFVNHRYWH